MKLVLCFAFVSIVFMVKIIIICILPGKKSYVDMNICVELLLKNYINIV